MSVTSDTSSSQASPQRESCCCECDKSQQTSGAEREKRGQVRTATSILSLATVSRLRMTFFSILTSCASFFARSGPKAPAALRRRACPERCCVRPGEDGKASSQGQLTESASAKETMRFGAGGRRGRVLAAGRSALIGMVAAPGRSRAVGCGAVPGSERPSAPSWRASSKSYA